LAEKKNNSLGYLAVIYMIGNFSSKILSFILVFFMTYFLSKEEIGEYDLILTSVSFIVPCVSLLIDNSLLRWLLDPDFENKKDEIFANTFNLLFINILLYTIIYWISSLFFSWNYRGLIYLYSINMILYPTILQGTRGLGKNKLYATISIFYSFFYVMLTFVSLYFLKGSIEGVLLANIIALFITIIRLLIQNGWVQYLKPMKPNFALLKSMSNYSLPLLPNTLSWWFISASTRYMILAYLGKEFNGLFAISYKVPTIILVVTSVFTLAWQEKAIRTIDDNDSVTIFNSVLKKYIKLILGIVIILGACSKFIMNFVSSEYYESWKYIPILLFAVFFQAISGFYGAGYLRAKKTKGIFYSSIIGGLVTVIISFFLVKPYGLYGVSWAILLGYFVLFLYRAIHIKKFLTIKFPTTLLITMTFLYMIIVSLLKLENKFVFPISLALSIIIFFYYNYNYLNIIKSKIDSKWRK